MKLVRPSAKQDFILLAESGPVKTPFFEAGKLKTAHDQNGALVGLVAILPHDEDRVAKKRRQGLLTKVDKSISEAIAEYASGKNLQRRLCAELLPELERARSSLACFFVRFALFRTGELRIWFELDEFLGRDLAQDPPEQVEILAAEHIAPQVYYFIKDLLHSHYHHDQHSDQLLPLTRLGSHPNTHQSDEVAWRYATLRGLVRVVVELRQAASLTGPKRAIGIIAYAQAFQSLLAKIVRNPQVEDDFDEPGEVIPYEFTNLIASIEAVGANSQSAATAQLQLFAIIIGIVLSGLALWAGAVQIQPILCEALSAQSGCPKPSSGPSATAINWIVANPTAFITALVVGGFAAFILFFRGTGAIPYAERFVRWTSRLGEAVAAEVSRRTLRSDGLGLFAGLAVILAPTILAAGVAWWLTPKREIPQPDQRIGVAGGRWAPLIRLTNQPLGESGLLTTSLLAPELRSLLADNFDEFFSLLGDGAILRRQGPLLVATPANGNRGEDTAYLLVDTMSDRFEAGLRVNGRLAVYRTAGERLARPASVRSLLGQSSDISSVPPEQTVCKIAQSGEANRVVQLSGQLRANDFCEYTLHLRHDQVVTFDRRRAPGLGVVAIENGRTWPVDPTFGPQRQGLVPIRVSWMGWNPTGSQAAQAREFYVRLELR